MRILWALLRLVGRKIRDWDKSIFHTVKESFTDTPRRADSAAKTLAERDGVVIDSDPEYLYAGAMQQVTGDQARRMRPRRVLPKRGRVEVRF